MTVYELIQELAKYEPDDDVMIVDGGEDVPIMSVKNMDGCLVLLPWADGKYED